MSIIKQDGLSLSLTNGKVYCDSRELAKQFGKRHDHVLRSIAKEVERFNLLKNGEIKKVDEYFKKSEYIDEKGRIPEIFIVIQRISTNSLTVYGR